ncbi:MAG: molybdopterin converting factor subunit 1 [Gammaproteobacteria bacterium]|nr:molybdopterin converting factor subunit 1 [Gammaproteobacteria bacterium]
MITIKYFARLSESLGMKSEEIEFNQANNTVESLMQSLVARGEPWTTEFSTENKILVAVNHELSNRQATLKQDDEVAFFPPVTGG